MYLAELVEVAIGLIVVYFLVSLASSQVLEWFSQLLKWRANDLETAIRGMILNQPVEPTMFSGLARWVRQLFKGKRPADDPAEKVIKQVYDHPLIKPLCQAGTKPANIPARTFALALFDAVMTAGTEASTIQQALYTVRGRLEDPQGLEKDVKAALDKLIKMATDAAHANDAQALKPLKAELDKFTQDYPKFGPVLDALLQVDPATANTALGQINHALAGVAVNNPDLKRTLESLISGVAISVKEGEDAVAAARTNVETWFNTTMGQLTSLYQRRSKLWAGVVALVLVALLNIDTFAIANALWREPTLRQMLVAYAEKLPPLPTPAPSVTAPVPPAPTAPITPTTPVTPTVPPAQAVSDLKAQLEGLQLPIGGWEVKTLTLEGTQTCAINPTIQDGWRIWWNGACKALALRDLQPGWRNLIVKLIGWVITALAAAQGAPFWFDVIRKLIELRGTKPEEKPAAK